MVWHGGPNDSIKSRAHDFSWPKAASRRKKKVRAPPLSSPLSLAANWANHAQWCSDCRLPRNATQQRLDTKAKATIAPAMISPRTPTRRSLFIMTPTRLRMKPSGVATMIVNPPRVVRGDPQPGRNSIIAASAPRAASEKHRPTRPKPALRAITGSAWMTGGSSIFERLKLHLDRLAGRLQRLKVELDVHDDFLANQVLGYSP
jgi:hypothetical protein